MNDINYTYGQPSLLVKQAVRNSFFAWKGQKKLTLEQETRRQRKKLKGMFIPNLFLGQSKFQPIPLQDRMFGTKNSRKWKNVDAKVKILVTACYIDYKTVRKLGYTIEKPEIKKVKADIDSFVFEHVVKGDMAAYREMWERNYATIIGEVFDNVEKNWNGGRLNEKIKKVFGKSYIYGSRKTANKWMDGLDEKELAEKFIEMGFSELEQKHITAIKRLRKSVKKVKEELNRFLSDEECRNKVKKITMRKQVNDWFFKKLDNRQKNDVLFFMNDLDKKEMRFENAKIVFLAYGYKPEWCSSGYFTWSPEMKPIYDQYKKTGYYGGLK